ASARELAHHLFVVAFRDAEAEEQLARVGLRGVAVLLGDDAFELAEPNALGVREILLTEELLLLRHGLPEPRVAHDHDVERAPGLEGELILLEDARALGPADLARVRLELTRQDLQERGLAGPVRSGEAVAAAGAEGRMDL